MQEIIWLTDTHLNFIKNTKDWWKQLTEKYPKAHSFLFTGDISSSSSLFKDLNDLGENHNVYYVLGNHDFYGSSIETIREEIQKSNFKAKYLTQESVIKLSETSSLIGDDGWYDGRNGTYWHSKVGMNDFNYIKEFQGVGKQIRLMIMQRYADRSANRIADLCKEACSDPNLKTLHVATHVPPFKEAAWYARQQSNNDYLPFFSNFVFGQAVASSTKAFRDAGGIVKVYCGHTHGEGVCQPSNNLTVFTGRAEYYYPEESGIIYFE